MWRGLSRRGDDGILDCLLRFQAAGAAGVNLCTGDKNLCIRVATEQVREPTLCSEIPTPEEHTLRR